MSLSLTTIGTAGATTGTVGSLGLGLGNTTYKPGDILNGIGKGLADFGNSIKDSFLDEDTPPELKVILNNGGWRHYASANGIPQNINAVKEHFMKNYNNQNNKPNNEDDEKNNNKTPNIAPTPNANNTTETTDTSTEPEQEGNSDTTFEKMLQLANEQQEKQWKREDEIRKETQEREDNAWQRAVADMRKAGVNPNLVNANPASSGGGITQSTGRESILSSEINNITSELINAIQNDTNISNNQRNNYMDLIKSFISLAGNYVFAKTLKKK